MLSFEGCQKPTTSLKVLSGVLNISINAVFIVLSNAFFFFPFFLFLLSLCTSRAMIFFSLEDLGGIEIIRKPKGNDSLQTFSVNGKQFRHWRAMWSLSQLFTICHCGVKSATDNMQMWVWLYCNKSSLMNKEILIWCNFHIMIYYFSDLKNVKTISGFQSYKNRSQAKFSSWATVYSPLG